MVALLGAFAGCGGENRTEPLPPYEPGTPDPLACVPNLDGKLFADEMVPTIGIPVSYRISPADTERTVDLVGTSDSAGNRVWDWSAPAADDQGLRLEAQALAGKWYAGWFPDGEFVTRADAGGAIEAVYRHEADALKLLGIASREPDPQEGRTLMPYDTPVDLFRFPIEEGKSWTSSATVQDGLYRGVPYAGTDTYAIDVPATGRLALPDFTFTQAHQVRIEVTVQPAFGYPVTTRQVSWLFECFGEVARATSRTDEPEENFTIAAEVRRLGL